MIYLKIDLTKAHFKPLNGIWLRKVPINQITLSKPSCLFQGLKKQGRAICSQSIIIRTCSQELKINRALNLAEASVLNRLGWMPWAFGGAGSSGQQGGAQAEATSVSPSRAFARLKAWRHKHNAGSESENEGEPGGNKAASSEFRRCRRPRSPGTLRA